MNKPNLPQERQAFIRLAHFGTPSATESACGDSRFFIVAVTTLPLHHIDGRTVDDLTDICVHVWSTPELPEPMASLDFPERG